MTIILEQRFLIYSCHSIKTIMKYCRTLMTLTILINFIGSCKKEENSTVDCFPAATTVRQITDKQATIQSAGEDFYIVEENTIDTRLNPCNLSQEFKIDNLSVKISGDVKETNRNVSGPCCTEDFVITAISR